MRQSRDKIGQFFPRTWDEISPLMQPSHPLNAPWRQTTSYWEMAYGMARHGIVNPDYLAENAGEGLFVFAKFQPFLERIRSEISPLAFHNVEWLLQNSAVARQRFEIIQARVRKMTEKPS
jgi:hypothetical protein